MKLSVVIPVYNEEDIIDQTVHEIVAELVENRIDFEIVLVNDTSTDNTREVLVDLQERYGQIVLTDNSLPRGFGRAVSSGLKVATGEAIVVVMGDMSDAPEDIVSYFRVLENGYDCAFGSRFIKGSTVDDYPKLKLLVNRLANKFVQCLFLLPYNDITNAFKGYRREVIEACWPFFSSYFNITVEIPLKAINRGFSYKVVPIKWYGRKSGVSKLKIKEMGRKYLFTTLYLWLEKVLLRDELKNRIKNTY